MGLFKEGLIHLSPYVRGKQGNPQVTPPPNLLHSAHRVLPLYVITALKQGCYYVYFRSILKYFYRRSILLSKMPFPLLLLLLPAMAYCEQRRVARVGLLAPVEHPEAEPLLRRAVAAFNSRSSWLLVQPVLVTISHEDPLLR